MEAGMTSGTVVPIPFEQSHTVLVLIGTMLIGGCMGALCRHYFDGASKKSRYPEIIIPGVVAAFVVPLFLSIGRSDVITTIIGGGKDLYANLFIIFAFCLLASVSARSFVDALAREAFNKAEKAEARAVSAESAADVAKEQAEETRDILSETIDERPHIVFDDVVSQNSFSPEILLSKAENDIEIAVIKALLRKPNLRRSSSSIAKEEGLTRASCLLALIALIHRDVVETFSSKTGATLYKLKEN